jgi:CBS domain-containing protein
MNLLPFCKPVVSVDHHATVAAVAARMRDDHVGAVVVTRDGRPYGLVTDRDLALRVLAERGGPDEAVHRFVTRDLETLNASQTVESAVTRMGELGIRRLPLVDDAGRLVGMVTADDLLIAFGREAGRLAEVLSNNTDTDDSR